MAALVSICALIVTVTFGWLTALRGQYERVVDVINFTSSTEIAEARHRLGLFLYDEDMQVSKDERDALLGDLFRVLWVFDRINAVRKTLPNLGVLGPNIAYRLSGPHELLRDSTSDWAAFWSKNLEKAVDLLGEPTVHADGSDRGLKDLTRHWNLQLAD